MRILGMCLDLDFIRFLSEYTQLESLSLFGRVHSTFNALATPIQFKSIKKFETFGSYHFLLSLGIVAFHFEIYAIFFEMI